jgi:hypothetical protein
MRTRDALRQHTRTISLLVSDLDGTLIPDRWNDDARKGLEDLRQMIVDQGLSVAYATGRHLELALEGIERYRLPPPAVLVCDVGTRIYIHDSDGWIEDEAYASRIAPKDTAIEHVRVLLDGIPGVTLQEAPKQGRFKASFYVDASTKEERIRERILSHLGDRAKGFTVIFSIDPGDGRGLLDLLPEGASKASATAYLGELFELSSERMLYAGDSGNDVDAMLSGFNAVLVGNATAAIRAELAAAAGRSGVREHVYFAKASYARGVIEGCRHFSFPPG